MPPRTIINPSHRSIDKALMHRIDSALVAMTEAEQIAYLSEAVYQERLRFHQDGEEITAKERDRVEGLARALTEGQEARRTATARLVRSYSHEVHNRFSERTFSAAMRLAPAAIKGLLSPSEAGGWAWPTWSVLSGWLGGGGGFQALAKTRLVFAPTHLSNLDSLLIGTRFTSLDYHRAPMARAQPLQQPHHGLPMSPCAYTDRRKRHRLYKDVPGVLTELPVGGRTRWSWRHRSRTGAGRTGEAGPGYAIAAGKRASQWDGSPEVLVVVGH